MIFKPRNSSMSRDRHFVAWNVLFISFHVFSLADFAYTLGSAATMPAPENFSELAETVESFAKEFFMTFSFYAKPCGIFPLIHFSFLELWLFNVWGMKLVWILFTFFSAPLASGYMIIPILLGLDS